MNDIEIRIQDYIDIKKEFKRLKDLEATMRITLVEKFFGTESVGTFHKEVHNYDLKCVKGVTMTLDIDEETILSDEEWDCVRTKYSLLKKNYEMLESSSNIDAFITTKPSMPTLEITE